MATIVPASQTTYSCRTQTEEQPSFGFAPASNLAGTTGDNAPEEPDDLVVGYGTIVPRWDTRGGAKLHYFVQIETFPSPDQASYADTCFQAAANSWNELELGVTITPTSRPEEANFYLVYKVNPKVGNGKGTLARAFFPHEINQDVIVFSRAYDNDTKPILKNVFQHEIGHILGLRHEFAITGDARNAKEKEVAVQFMKKNLNSVMSYNFPPQLQDSDQEQVVEFYKLLNGFMIGGIAITDFQTRIREPDR